MLLPEPLLPGKLIRRYKRFLADIRLGDGKEVTAHCPNSGSMKSLLQTGAEVLLSVSPNPKRKLPYTWELVKYRGSWVGVNTARTNHLVREALEKKVIPELAGYPEIRAEVPWAKGTRFDFLLKNGNDECFVEVKNVTLAQGEMALFPDSVTARGTRHLQELINVRQAGKRAVIFFVVNRQDCKLFRPADDIDAVYGRTLRQAVERGVRMLVYTVKIAPPTARLTVRLPFELP